MRQKIIQFIEKELNLAPKSKLVLGVSGGVDSVVLTHILNDLGYDCVVAHCNFHLRGEESARDEKFVEDLAEKLHLHYEKVDFDTKKIAKENKLSIEMAARELRYAWFEDLRQMSNAQYIAIAHHADDSIETLLLNLIRGTGLRGLKGIDAVNGKIIRPLICCTRSEIELYAKEHGLDYIFDSSNAETDFTRNKIRLEILPQLALINPSIKQTLFETTRRLQGTLKIFEQAVAKIKSEITFIEDEKLYIDIEKLKQQADAKTVLFEILQPYGFNSDVINQIVDNFDGTSGLKFYAPNCILIKDRRHLIVSAKIEEEDIEIEISKDTSEIQFPMPLIINKICRDSNFEVSKSPDKIHLDLDKIKYPLILRKWHEGDFFYPFGMKNSKKLSDFLIDEKINILEKQAVWTLISDEKIVWIVGKRLDNRFRITDETKNVLEISIK